MLYYTKCPFNSHVTDFVHRLPDVSFRFFDNYLIGPATAVVTARIMPPPASTDSIQKARQLKAESQLSNAAGVRKRALPSTAALADDGESSGSNFQLLVEEKYDTIT